MEDQAIEIGDGQTLYTMLENELSEVQAKCIGFMPDTQTPVWVFRDYVHPPAPGTTSQRYVSFDNIGSFLWFQTKAEAYEWVIVNRQLGVIMMEHQLSLAIASEGEYK